MLKGGLFSIFSFFSQGISFLLLIILAKYIAPDDYGKLSLFNTVFSVVGIFIGLSTQGYVGVSFFKKEKQEFKEDFSSILFISFVTFFLFVFILLLADNTISSYLQLTTYIVWIAVIVAFFNSIYLILLDLYRVKESIGKYGLLSCSWVIINFCLTLLLIIQYQTGWIGRIYSQLVCCLIFGSVALIVFYKWQLINLKNLSWTKIKLITLWGIPLIPHLASGWIRQGGDRYIINYFHTLEDVGLFSFALNLTNIIVMIGSSFNASNSVLIYKILSSNSSDKYRLLSRQMNQIFRVYICGVLFVVVGCMVLVPVLLPKYTSSLPYFYILAVYGFLRCIYYLFTNYLFYFDETKVLMSITFTCSIIHIILSLFLTRFSLYWTCCIYVFINFVIDYFVIYKSRQVINNHILNE